MAGGIYIIQMPLSVFASAIHPLPPEKVMQYTKATAKQHNTAQNIVSIAVPMQGFECPARIAY